jgi:hypothetical protein
MQVILCIIEVNFSDALQMQLAFATSNVVLNKLFKQIRYCFSNPLLMQIAFATSNVLQNELFEKLNYCKPLHLKHSCDETFLCTMMSQLNGSSSMMLVPNSPRTNIQAE